MTRRTIARGLLMGLLLPLLTQPLMAQEPGFTRREDVIYGRKYGTALTMDVFTPQADGNGTGIIFVVSGGWFSSHESISGAFLQPFLKRGYTVFAVVHGSQPKFTIPEAIADMNRAVRYIRHHAADFKIDPDRLGVTGASAGGHLSLMLGLAGSAGDPAAKDPVDRESSRVKAVACFFPPTDFLNYGKPGENAMGRGVLANYRAPFDIQEFDNTRKEFEPVTDEQKLLELAKQISPVYHVSADDPPTLIIHGDADQLVPIQQAQLVMDGLKAAEVPHELMVRPGAAHGWSNIVEDIEHFADWFDKYLPPARPTP